MTMNASRQSFEGLFFLPGRWRPFVSGFTLLMTLWICSSPALADLRMATWNVEWLFDEVVNSRDSDLEASMSAPSRVAYESRIRRIARAIADIKPDFMALQEIEGANVLADLAARLLAYHGQDYGYAFVPGVDTYTGQEVGLLFRSGWRVRAKRFRFDKHAIPGGRNLSKHLHVVAQRHGRKLSLVVVHLITERQKRLQQARTLRHWLRQFEDVSLVVMGDMNSRLAGNELTPDSDLGTLLGWQTVTKSDDLYDSHQQLGRQATHVSGAPLDRILLSEDLWNRLDRVTTRRALAVQGRVDHQRSVDYSLPESEQDLSDHYPLIVDLSD